MTDEALTELGWRQFFDEQMSDSDWEETITVRVMAVHRGKIAVAGAALDLLIPPHIPAMDGGGSHPTVGDWILLDRVSHEPRRLLDRENLFRGPPPVLTGSIS